MGHHWRATFGRTLAALTLALAAFDGVGRAQDAPPAGDAAEPTRPAREIRQGSLVVRARTGEGAPIAGAVAEAWLVPAPMQWNWGISGTEPTLATRAVTDAAGVATIAVENSAAWRVSVRAPGRATETRTVRAFTGLVTDETFHLAAGFALGGRVVDQTNAGAAGVTVYAGHVGWEGDLAHFLAKTTTDAEGGYRIEGLAKGPIDVWASRGGVGLRWIARLDVPGFETFDFEFQRGGRMTGVVRDVENGAVVAGARVRAFEFSGDCVAQCVTDANGVYVLDATAPRVALDRVTVEAPGRVLIDDDPRLPPERRIVLATSGTYECDLNLRLGARVVGTITGDGKPLAGSTVTLWTLADDPRREWRDRTTTTGADGSYVFDGIDVGDVVVQAAAYGWVHRGFATRFAPGLLRHEKAPASARAKAPKSGDVRIDVELVRAVADEAPGRVNDRRTISGHLVDDAHRPVAGVEISCGDAAAMTAADGAFRLEGAECGPPTGGKLTESAGSLVVTIRGGAYDDVDAVLNFLTKDVVVVVRTKRAGAVRVVDDDGKPVAGATVTFGERDSSSFGGIRQWPPVPATFAVTTGPDGRAKFWEEEVRAAGDEVVVRAPGFATARATIDGTALTTAGVFDVTVARGRDVVVSAVAGTPPVPVPGAWLTLGPDEDAGPPSISALAPADQRSEIYVGRTDASGTSRLRDVGPAPIRVHVYAAGHYAVERRIVSDTNAVTIDMNAHLSISGRFVLEDGSPGAGVTYCVFWVDHPEGWQCYFGPATAGPDGAFRLDAARPGQYEVEAMHDAGDEVPDYAPRVAGPYAAGTKGIVVNLRKGRRLAGVVVGPDGKGVAGAELCISPRTTFGVSFIRDLPTGADGAFTVDRAPQGPVYVQVTDDSGEGGRARRVVTLGPVDPKPDEPFRIVLDEGLAIEGRLVDGEGQAMAGRPLLAIPADVTEWSWDPRCGCVTDDDGRFRIPGLAPGTYRIWYAPDDWRNAGGYNFGNGPGPHPIDPDAGTPAGTKDLTLTWK